MRAAGRAERTVVPTMSFGDFSLATRSYTLARATAASETVLAAMGALLRSVAPVIERKGLRSSASRSPTWTPAAAGFSSSCR
jgi:DNA polymerase IV